MASARIRISLRVKLAVLAASVAVGAVGALAIFTVWWLPFRSGAAELEDRVEETARLIASGVAVGVGGEFGEVDQRLLALYVDNADKVGLHVAYALLLDREGEAQMDKSRVNPAMLEQFEPALAAMWREGRREEVLARLAGGPVHGPHKSRVTNIKSGGAVVGRLVVGFSTRALVVNAEKNILISLVVLAGALALGLGGALVVAGRVSRPIHDLAEAMEKVAAGDLTQRVPVESDDEVGMLAHAFNDMTTGLGERLRLKGTLDRYMSSDVVERILAEKADIDLEGELVQISVLFLDIRDFTEISERLPPREVVQILNEYLATIIEVIFKYEGTINKFIGDSVMAIYGAPREVSEPELKAVRTAIEIQRRVAEKSSERRAAGREIIEVGIGINSGAAIAGNVGSELRMEYTVIGDDVNVAQRLEAQAGPGQILVSEATFQRVAGAVDARALEAVRVKGKSQAVRIYEITGLREVLAGVTA